MIAPNGWLIAFVLFYLFQTAFELWLEKRNVDHLRRWGRRVPPSFEAFIDGSRLKRITEYTLEKTRLGIVEGLVSEVALLAVLLCGVLPYLAAVFTDWGLGGVSAGLLFFLAIGLFETALDLPFDYVSTFGIEEKYGFNESTRKLWVMDHFKEALLSVLLAGPLLALVLLLLERFPDSWWLWVFLVVSGFQVVMAMLYPVLIAPLFNTFTPLEDQELEGKIRDLMERGGIKLKGIFQMDAGRRSRHSNAYFTGFGRTKRVVLFDTLLESHPHREILAVLAHELGHFREKHILKQLLFMEITLLAGLYATYWVMQQPQLYGVFGFEAPEPYAGLLLVGILWQKVGFFVQPLLMALSRRFERQADRFAVELSGAAVALSDALKRMAADNLSNLTPDPLYVSFHYSHPPLVERVRVLEKSSMQQPKEK